MSTSQITIGSNTINVVALPTSPGFREVEFDFSDAVGTVSMPFTGQQQVQQWPGADMWGCMVTLPPMIQADADGWISFLMELRGKSFGVMIGDPLKTMPRGNVQGSVPLVDGSVGANNAAMTTTLYTKGWKPNAFRLLLPGDAVQVGYRFHRNLNPVNADSSGNAVLNLYPSLREHPVDGLPLILRNPQGLFRRASNKGSWASSYSGLSHISFPLLEYR